jgi:hypothetical protein
MVCPWGAGGGTDACSRIIATLLKKELGVPVNVVNRTGGSGAVGHTAMATGKPDGYTIGMPTVEITMMHWMGLTKITYKDITPIALVNADPSAINGLGYRPGRHLAPGYGRVAESDWSFARCHQVDPQQGCRSGSAGPDGRRHRHEHLFLA